MPSRLLPIEISPSSKMWQWHAFRGELAARKAYYAICKAIMEGGAIGIKAPHIKASEVPKFLAPGEILGSHGHASKVKIVALFFSNDAMELKRQIYPENTMGFAVKKLHGTKHMCSIKDYINE
ncbi:hypothetical protein Ancab_031984 [Ancistrocladus abbreviatus]